MKEENIKQLLDDVRLIVTSNRAENYKNGREFNIFYVQGIASDEVRVCRLMRELLDPSGSHGQGDAFLKRFVEVVLKDEDYAFGEKDYQHARVVCEETIDSLRRIDIVIRIGNRLIPIEVKVYAGDQDKQCNDYYQYAARIDPEAKIYYLTLDGHEPSKESKGNLSDSQYKCLSFSDDIIDWLDDCIAAREIEQIYSVREILIQFRSVLRDMTGKQEGRLEMIVKEKIGESYDSVVAAVQIEKALPDVKADKMREVFTGIKEHMEVLGYKESVDTYSEEAIQYYKYGKKSWPSLNYTVPVDDSVKNKIVLRFEIEHKLYFGICPWNGRNNWETPKDNHTSEYISKNLTPEFIKKETTASTWYWWMYLNEDSDVNFKYCNADYLKLFDECEFKAYMEKVYDTIDRVIKDIMDRKGDA